MYHCGAVVNPTSISMMKAESALCTADVNQQHHDENGSPGADAAPGCKVQQDMFQGVDAQEEDTAVTSEAGVWPSTELRVALCTSRTRILRRPRHTFERKRLRANLWHDFSASKQPCLAFAEIRIR